MNSCKAPTYTIFSLGSLKVGLKMILPFLLALGMLLVAYMLQADVLPLPIPHTFVVATLVLWIYTTGWFANLFVYKVTRALSWQSVFFVGWQIVWRAVLVQIGMRVFVGLFVAIDIAERPVSAAVLGFPIMLFVFGWATQAVGIKQGLLCEK